MEEAKKSGNGDAIKGLVSIIRCRIRIEEGESKKFAVEGGYKDLVSKMLEVPVGSKVSEMFMLELLLNADSAVHDVWRRSEIDTKKYAHPLCLGIAIVPDEKNQTLSIIDTGIGMTKDDLMKRLISLNRSNNLRLFRHMDNMYKFFACEANADLPDLYKKEFGGLGLYSAFMVAYKVVITTKEDGHYPYVWELNTNDKGAGGSCFSFSIAPATASRAPGCGSFHRGTKVTLHLKDGCREFLRVDKLQELVNKCVKVYPLFNPIFIILNDNEKSSLTVFKRPIDVKEEEVPIEELKNKYKGVLETFAEHIRHMANKVDVVFSDRAKRVFCNLVVFGDDGHKPVLEINPRFSDDIEKLRKLLESVKSYDKKLTTALSLPEDDDKLRLYENMKKKKEAALKCKIRDELLISLIKFQCYDILYGTSFYEDAVKAIGYVVGS